MTEKKHLLSDILNQSSKFFQPKLWKAQKTLHDTLLWVDSKNYPKLIPAEPAGAELQKFQNPAKAMLSWADKQQQSWQLSGVLHSKANREFGVALKFVQRRTQEDRLGPVPMHWVAPQLHSAELVVSDAKNAEPKKTHRVFRKSSLLGHKGFFSQDLLHLEVGGWFLQSTDFKSYKLCASNREFNLFLELTPMKPVSYLGEAGYLQRLGVADEGAFYCLLPRLKVSGHMSIDGRLHFVSGIFRLEHEKKTVLDPFATNRPELGDSLSLSLENGCELIYFQNQTLGSQAYWIDAGGACSSFVSSEIREEVLQYWTSPHTGIRYPLKRRLHLAPLDVTLEIEPTSLNQENHSAIFGSNWSGQVSCHGSVLGMGFAVCYGSTPKQKLKLNHNLAKNFSSLNPLVSFRKFF